MTTSAVRKHEIIQDMTEARKSIIELIQVLTPDQWNVVFLGEWNLFDLLAHLVGWDQTNLQAIQELREARLPEFYSYKDPDWRKYNALLVERHRINDNQIMLERVQSSHAQLVAIADTIEPRDFERDWGVRYKGYRVTIGRLLAAEARDEKVHARQISRYFVDPPQTSGDLAT